MEADINYSKELLDWMPRILFEDGLESTVKWTLNQIGRFYD
jgi:nucleoside-diphosphate-sugar epimerase